MKKPSFFAQFIKLLTLKSQSWGVLNWCIPFFEKIFTECANKCKDGGRILLHILLQQPI
jgi:hypothetical protein